MVLCPREQTIPKAFYLSAATQPAGEAQTKDMPPAKAQG
jgi:hypothetical protein